MAPDAGLAGPGDGTVAAAALLFVDTRGSFITVHKRLFLGIRFDRERNR